MICEATMTSEAEDVPEKSIRLDIGLAKFRAVAGMLQSYRELEPEASKEMSNAGFDRSRPYPTTLA